MKKRILTFTLLGIAISYTCFAQGSSLNSFYVGVGQYDGTTSVKNFVNLGSNNHGSLLLASNLYFSGNDNLKIANTHETLSGTAILMPGNSMPNQGSILFFTRPFAPVKADLDYIGAPAMIINGVGNIGVGTLTPLEKLSVNGKIRAKEIKVENANWPDYVFSKDYLLPSLQETGKYIGEKGHLPGIPSASEVKANGIDVGEMNARLLQKIEELTLHLINLEKNSEKQQKEIDLLKSERLK